MILPLILLYILPAILSIIVIYIKEREVTRGDLIGIILASLVPIFNWISGYIGGLITLCESKTVNNFFNKRIK
jgi:hypothetical protein